MNGVLVDTSVWIAYFRGRPEDRSSSDALDYLLSGCEAVINDVILTELLPSMRVRGESEIATLMCALRRPVMDIDWEDLRNLQETCLRAGINRIGLPDLMIAQQAIRFDLPLFSLDKHFELIATVAPLRSWPRQSNGAMLTAN